MQIAYSICLLCSHPVAVFALPTYDLVIAHHWHYDICIPTLGQLPKGDLDYRNAQLSKLTVAKGNETRTSRQLLDVSHVKDCLSQPLFPTRSNCIDTRPTLANACFRMPQNGILAAGMMHHHQPMTVSPLFVSLFPLGLRMGSHASIPRRPKDASC